MPIYIRFELSTTVFKWNWASSKDASEFLLCHTWIGLVPKLTNPSYSKVYTAHHLTFSPQTFRRNNQTMIVPQRPHQAPTAAKQTCSVMKQTAALVSHWCRCLTQKTLRQGRWEHHLYLLGTVRQQLINQKLFLEKFFWAQIVSGLCLFIISDEWLPLWSKPLQSIVYLSPGHLSVEDCY